MKHGVLRIVGLALMACVLMAGLTFAQGKVDINQAGVDDLKTLRGIGEVRANAIVKYRQMHGPFKSLDDLKNVPGIGDKIIQDNKSMLAIQGGMTGKKGGMEKAEKAMAGSKDKTKKSMTGSTEKAKKAISGATEKAKKDK